MEIVNGLAPFSSELQSDALLLMLHNQKIVDMVGLAPTMRVAADLQSTGVTNFPTYPKSKIHLKIKFKIGG